MIVSILIGIVILLWFIQQYLINQLYYQTPQYVNSQQKIESLKRANNQLNQEDLRLRSYTYIEQIAREKGYISGPIIFIK